MDKIVVLKTEGKGRDRADYVTVHLFDNPQEANDFCTKNIDLESKYWTYCEIITPGEKIEPWYGENL